LENVTTGIDSGLAVRVLFGDRQALASANDCSPAKLAELAGEVSSAVDQGQPLTVSEWTAGTAGPTFQPEVWPDAVDAAEKIDAVRRAEAAARAYDDRVRQVKVVYGDRVRRVVVLGSDGRISSDRRLSTVFFVQVLAVQGGVYQMGYEPVGGSLGFELFKERPPEEVARTAAARAVLMLEADEAPSGAMPVVLSSAAGGTMIHEAVGHGLEADLTLEGVSVYSGRVGRMVASSLVTVIDDGAMPYRRGSGAVDDEGVITGPTTLIENGVLKSYMHNRRTAIKSGGASTGNGRRESYRHPPIVRMTNTYIAPGTTDPADILADTPRGLLVKKMGGGQVNTINGHFVFDVSEGYLIENGRQGPPVRGATLTGSGPRILEQIDMVGADLGFAIGTCGKDGQGAPVSDAQPTLRIPEIVVGGRKGT
jgi:TldD protein